MLKFKKFNVNNVKKMQRFTKNSVYPLSDFSGGVMFMWRKTFNYEYSIYNDTLILKTGDSAPAFFPPLGADVDGALTQIEKYCTENEFSLKFICSPQSFLEKLIKRYGEKVKYSFERRWSDYVYDYEEIMTFKGKKFSGQRNHINGFKKNYPNYKYKKVTKKDIPALVDFLNEYKREHADMKGVEKKEFLNTLLLTKNLSLGTFKAGYLEVNGKIVAFSIGEYAGNMLIIHVEKALKNYRGVYPTAFNEFVKFCAINGVKYINREDDSGDEGLRTSKMQYKPIRLENKYYVKIDSPLTIDKVKTLKSGNIILNKIKSKDAKTYYNLNVQKANNKYWGYNYKKHIKNPQINDFYLMQKRDFKNRINVCYAIRLKGVSEMIGEVILYNFSYNNSVEVGIRLLKKYQKKGYAQKALALALEYIDNTLKMKAISKCYKQNENSKNLLLKVGFNCVLQDEKYYYFER